MKTHRNNSGKRVSEIVGNPLRPTDHDAQPIEALASRGHTPQAPQAYQELQDGQEPHGTASGRSTATRQVSSYSEFVEAIESRRVPRLPVDVHVEYAARYHLDNQEQDEYPEWHSPVWWFCWVAKGHPDLNDLDGDQALDFIEHILKTRVSGYLDVWCEAIGVVREEVLDAFPTTWDEVRVPPGSSRLRVAERLATECPLIREGNIRKSRSARYLRLLNVCAWLAFMQEGRFFLARRTVAEALGCNDRHAGRVIDLAIRDGFVHRAHRYRPIERKADEYRFNLDLLPPGASDIAQRELGPGVRDQFREEL